MQDSVSSKNLVQEVPAKVPDLAALTQENDEFADKHGAWLEAEGIRAFMAKQHETLFLNILAIPLIFISMFGHVNLLGLCLWACVIALLQCYRFWVSNYFNKQSPTWLTTDFLSFHQKNAWVSVCIAAMWGILVWLFYAKSPLLIQFIAWICLTCVGFFAATGCAEHYKALKHFIHSLFSVSLLGMLWGDYTAIDSEVSLMTFKLIPLVLLLWLILLVYGKRLNNAFCQRMVLRKGNKELIDSLKAQTERAVNAIDMKNRLLASAAHDIRQPVLALDLYANMLRSDPHLAPTLTPKITVATRSVIEMFDSLFDLSRLETGQIQINKSDINIATFMDELFLQYQPAAQLKGLILRLHTCQAQIYSDPQLLKRAIGNLIANAIKFTENNGVLLACRKTSKGVLFEVWDTGMGIEPEQQKAVFQEFYKAPLIANAPIGMNDGFGLGLSIVSRFCETLGHTFSMGSRVGKGSVFRITVEAVPADAHKK